MLCFFVLVHYTKKKCMTALLKPFMFLFIPFKVIYVKTGVYIYTQEGVQRPL